MFFGKPGEPLAEYMARIRHLTKDGLETEMAEIGQIMLDRKREIKTAERAIRRYEGEIRAIGEELLFIRNAHVAVMKELLEDEN